MIYLIFTRKNARNKVTAETINARIVAEMEDQSTSCIRVNTINYLKILWGRGWRYCESYRSVLWNRFTSLERPQYFWELKLPTAKIQVVQVGSPITRSCIKDAENIEGSKRNFSHVHTLLVLRRSIGEGRSRLLSQWWERPSDWLVVY